MSVEQHTYVESWRALLRGEGYDFQLTDWSLFHFYRESREKVSYAYYECPFAVSRYDEFLASRGISLDEAGWAFQEEYELHLDTAPLKETAFPMRYDYDPAQHRPGGHPASHIHLGFRTPIRLATERILRPISFVLFVVRQRYPTHWVRLLELETHPRVEGHVRSGLPTIPDSCLQEVDRLELILT